MSVMTMMLIAFVVGYGCVSVEIAGAAEESTAFPGKVSEWNGFDRYDFEVGGRPVMVIAPDQAAQGKPWVWHGEFFGHKPAPDIELLRRGFHVVYMRVPNLLGSPKAVNYWDQCYDALTRVHGLAKQVALVGLSRGGLYCYNWASQNPDRVTCIYGDAPVCDFKSWPGGQWKGKGSPRDWNLVLKEYGFATDAEANAYEGNPVDSLKKLAEAKVPLLHVYGDADKVVPWDENTGLIAKAYREMGGQITLIAKPGVGHHPHGLQDPSPIVDFIVSNSGILKSKVSKKKLDPVDAIAVTLEPAKRIVFKTVQETRGDTSLESRELYLHVFNPAGWQVGQKRSCFVVIHGGGWAGGVPRRMYPFASHFAKLGMVGISVHYRLLNSSKGSDVFDSVRDARSAIRFIKSNANQLGIDETKIAVSGASAGGHLAAATCLFDDVNDKADNLDFTPDPAALLLLFPVIDTSAEGYGQRKIGEDWQRISPLHRVVSGSPPTIIFHGTGDKVTPFTGASSFRDAMLAAGNACELISHDGGRHGYLMFDQELFEATLARMEQFLIAQKLLTSPGFPGPR